MIANHVPETPRVTLSSFVRPGDIHSVLAQNINTFLKPGREWQMLVDLKKQLIFPREITTTTLHPDMFMWSAEDKTVFIIELNLKASTNLKTGNLLMTQVCILEITVQTHLFLRDVGIFSGNYCIVL